MLLGCDLYEENPVTDWAALAGSIQFVVLRLTWGVNRPDVDVRSKMLGAQGVGLPFALYHEWDPLGPAAGLQAEYFNSLVNVLPGHPPLALGLEESTPDPAVFAHDFAQTLIWLGRKPPIVYLSDSMLAENDWTPVQQLDCGLWLAQWDGIANAPLGTTPWQFAAMKQYSDVGWLPGVQGFVDLDAFYGDAAAFARYG